MNINWMMIFTFLGLFVESLLSYKLFLAMLDPRFSKRKTTAVFFSVIILNTIKTIFMMGQSTLKLITSIIIVHILINVLFEGKWVRKALTHMMSLGCSMMAEFVSVILAQTVYKCDIKNFGSGGIEVYMWQLSTYIIIFIFYTSLIMLVRRHNIDTDNKPRQLIYLYMSVQCLMISAFVAVATEYAVPTGMIFALSLMVVVPTFLIGVMLYRSIKESILRSAELEYAKRESTIKDRHYIELKEQYLDYRSLRRDFYNHIKIIDGLDDPFEIKNYTDELKDKINSMERTSFCNNPTLDALLALKRNEAKQKDIKVNFEICDTENISVSDFDLCTVVANLLDNGIEAASETEKKMLDMVITKKMNRLVITMKNSSGERNNDLHTTKQDAENHGIGLSSIRKVSEKYDGDCVFKFDEGIFYSIINMKY